MPGDVRLGAVLRELRTSRHLTLATVARTAGCAESLLSYVESGRRQLQPWLAGQLDTIYGTGGAVSALLRGTTERGRQGPALGVASTDDVLLVQLPEGGAPVPVSRRELLAGLGIGAIGGAILGPLEHVVARLADANDPLASFEASFDGFQAAVRTLPPARLVDAMTGNVAVIDMFRRQIDESARAAYLVMQARYAESLSWLSEEAGDVAGALYWADRAAQWAQAANWSPMVAYTFVRRSMMSISFANDGMRAVDNARAVIDMAEAPARVKGLAAKQMAFGYALAQAPAASAEVLDDAMRLLDSPVREDEQALGQRSVVSDDLYAIYRATCDIYLGRSDRVIPVLEPRLDALANASVRTATITQAKLTRAYANAGLPSEACRLAWQTLDAIDKVGSSSAHSELRRTLPVLRYWQGRSDVQDIANRLRPSGAR